VDPLRPRKQKMTRHKHIAQLYQPPGGLDPRANNVAGMASSNPAQLQVSFR
jgi:hypothetical protein